MKRVDMIGKKFGRLTVTKLSNKTSGKRKRLLYLCDCDCGTKNIEVMGEKLRRGTTKSCGCLAKEIASITHSKQNKFDLSNDYGIFYTTNTNKKVLFDIEDYEKISSFAWYELKNGYIGTKDKNTRKLVYLHRFIMNATNNEIVDHIGHCLSDVRKDYLRKGSQTNNAMNSVLRKDNTSGIKGVWYMQKSDKWVAEIIVNKKKIYLGSFTNKQEAITIRKEAEQLYFGNWSFDNSIDLYSKEVI